VARLDIAVFSESRVKVCRSKDGQRVRDARREMQAEGCAVLARRLALLVGPEQVHPHQALGAVLHRSIASRGRRRSNRAARSECCFVHLAWPT